MKVLSAAAVLILLSTADPALASNEFGGSTCPCQADPKIQQAVQKVVSRSQPQKRGKFASEHPKVYASWKRVRRFAAATLPVVEWCGAVAQVLNCFHVIP